MEKNELITVEMTKFVKKLCIYLVIMNLFIVISIFVPVLALKIIGAILSAYMIKNWIDVWKMIKDWDDVPPKTIGAKFDEIIYSNKDDLT